MKDHLRLDRSRLLGFKLTTQAGTQFEASSCDPRMGAKNGIKGPAYKAKLAAEALARKA